MPNGASRIHRTGAVTAARGPRDRAGGEGRFVDGNIDHCDRASRRLRSSAIEAISARARRPAARIRRNGNRMADPLAAGVIAVVLKGYPRLSETFIAQELLALEQRGVALALYSLRHPTDAATHPVHAEIRAPVTYLPEYLHDEPARVWRAWRIARRSQATAPRARPGGAISGATPRETACAASDRRCVLAAELPRDVVHLHAHFLHTPASVTRYAALLRGIALELLGAREGHLDAACVGETREARRRARGRRRARRQRRSSAPDRRRTRRASTSSTTASIRRGFRCRAPCAGCAMAATRAHPVDAPRRRPGRRQEGLRRPAARARAASAGAALAACAHVGGGPLLDRS